LIESVKRRFAEAGLTARQAQLPQFERVLHPLGPSPEGRRSRSRVWNADQANGRSALASSRTTQPRILCENDRRRQAELLMQVEFQRLPARTK
jgi:hypothetical protein